LKRSLVASRTEGLKSCRTFVVPHALSVGGGGLMTLLGRAALRRRAFYVPFLPNTPLI